ncbi:hypothetical protein BN137_2896 [Cronobacter condimenti 1330]|uniref:Uncharacterized protein n=1 Tax=Cronobacter condimenti 1330 TaxID=1073999 RepID=K8ACM0_9ENTR|nr:hypothetical protein BN137_2896 [Cronobacter condimenti 1330]
MALNRKPYLGLMEQKANRERYGHQSLERLDDERDDFTAPSHFP